MAKNNWDIWASHKSKPEKSSNISLQNYTYDFTATESSKGGTLIYIDQNVKYKIREDLKLYKSKEIKSTFLEITKKKIVGCLYKHPGVFFCSKHPNSHLLTICFIYNDINKNIKGNITTSFFWPLNSVFSCNQQTLGCPFTDKVIFISTLKHQ